MPGRTGKARRPKTDYAAGITARIVELIEAGEGLPWRRPWNGGDGVPRRSTGEPYRGINHIFLQMEGMAGGYASPYWLSFAQARALGGSVRKGERSVPVVFYGTAQRRDSGEPGTGADKDREGEGHYRFLKGYRVFNACQIDGLPDRFYADPTGIKTDGPRSVAELDAFFARLPVRIRQGGDIAAYVEARDEIVIPPPGRFDSAAAFYETLLHELSHASGIARRLNRPCYGAYHRDIAARAEEELVAELTSVLAGPCLGLGCPHLDNHAAYVKSWLSRLKNDRRWIFRCAAAAQQAADWIFGAGEAAAD